MTRFEQAQQRRKDALGYIAQTPGALSQLNRLPEDQIRLIVGKVEEKLQSETPQKYATPVTREYGRGARKRTVTEHVPVLDPDSERMMSILAEMPDEDLKDISSAELLALSQSLPLEDLYPERMKALRNIGRDRTGIGDNDNKLLAVARGAIPFGGDIFDLSEEEVASLMLQNPNYQDAESTAAIMSMFGGAAGGFKLIGKLDKIGTTGKIGLNLLKEGVIGTAYADAAPGILPTVLDKPDDHALNFIESMAIAGTMDAGIGLVRMLRGKTIGQARSVLADAAKAGEIDGSKLPDKLNPTLSGKTEYTKTGGKEVVDVLPAESPVKRFYKTQLKRGGGLPDEAFTSKNKFDGTRESNAWLLSKDMEQVRKEMKRKYGKTIPDKAIDDLNKILHGDTATDADDFIQDLGHKMRNNIERKTKELRSYVGEDLQATFDKNLDTYVHRSYEVHDNPNWTKKVRKDPKLRDSYSRAFAFLKEQHPDLEDVGIHNMLDRIIDPKTYKGDLNDKLMLIGMGRGILKHRKDIPDALREVMGEYKDPFVNYVKTMTKVDNLIQNKKMVQELVEKGEGKWLFRDPKTAPIRGVKNKVGGDFDGIKDMYATDDVIHALRTMGEAAPLPTEGALSAYRYALMLKSVSQVSKTVMSPAAHLRNFQGSAIMAAANGNFSRGGLSVIGGNVAGGAAGAASIDEDDGVVEATAKVLSGAALGTLAGTGGAMLLRDKKFAHAVKVVGNDIMNRGSKEFNEEYARYLKDQVVESSVTFKEMRKVLQDAGAKGHSALEKLTDTKPVKAVFDAYRGQDDIWKIYTHMAERDKLIKRGWSKQAAWDRATKITLNNLPNYGRTGRLVQNLRRMPFGNFVSFPAEILRNTANITRTAVEEMGTEGLRDIGLKRLGSFLGVAMGGSGAAASLFRHIHGVSKEDDLRIGEDSAPWARNSTRLYMGKDTSGPYPKIDFVDISYTDPYMYAKEGAITALNEMQRGGSPEDVAFNVVGRGLQKMLSPFVDPSIITQAISEINTGATADGRKIYDREVDDWDEVVTKSMMHVFNKAFLPGGVKDVMDLSNPYKDRPSETMQLFTGIRKQQYDPMEALRFRSGSFSANTQEIRSRFSRMAGNRKTTSDTVVDTYAQTNQKLFDQQKQMYRTVLNARKGGLTEGQIRNRLKASGISRDTINKLMRGQFDPMQISSSANQKLLENSVDYPREDVLALWRQYRDLKLDGEFDPEN